MVSIPRVATIQCNVAVIEGPSLFSSSKNDDPRPNSPNQLNTVVRFGVLALASESVSHFGLNWHENLTESLHATNFLKRWL